MFARRGLIGCPCPVPVSLTSSLPSSMTPTLIHFQIRRSTLPSVTRFSIISTSVARTILSKYERMSISRTHPMGRAQITLPFVQRLMLPPSGPKPVGAPEKVLLVDGVQQIHHHFLHELILQGGYRDWPLFPIRFGDIHSA